MLECVIGFDYYMKFEHLMSLPVHFIFFKNDKINQILITSFPEYFFSISKDVRMDNGLQFFASKDEVTSAMGEADLEYDYEWYLLKSCFYFTKGLTFNFRDGEFRTAHIHNVVSTEKANQFAKDLKSR